MRESRKYLDFFKKNIKWLACGLAIGLCVGLVFINKESHRSVSEGVYEVFPGDNPTIDYVVQVDSAVASVRARYKTELSKRGEELTVYKSGPLVVNVVVEGVNQNVINSNNQIGQVLVDEYSFHKITDTKIFQKQIQWLFLIFFSLIGIGAAFVAVLVNSYFKNY